MPPHVALGISHCYRFVPCDLQTSPTTSFKPNMTVIDDAISTKGSMEAYEKYWHEEGKRKLLRVLRISENVPVVHGIETLMDKDSKLPIKRDSYAFEFEFTITEKNGISKFYIGVEFTLLHVLSGDRDCREIQIFNLYKLIESEINRRCQIKPARTNGNIRIPRFLSFNPGNTIIFVYEVFKLRHIARMVVRVVNFLRTLRRTLCSSTPTITVFSWTRSKRITRWLFSICCKVMVKGTVFSRKYRVFG